MVILFYFIQEKSDINWDNVQIRILFFMNNMRNLVKLVLKCIRQINQATPNLYGITDLFALVINTGLILYELIEIPIPI